MEQRITPTAVSSVIDDPTQDLCLPKAKRSKYRVVKYWVEDDDLRDKGFWSYQIELRVLWVFWTIIKPNERSLDDAKAWIQTQNEKVNKKPQIVYEE